MRKFDVSCLSAAVLLIASNILYFVFVAQYRNRPQFDFQAWKDLDPTVIQEEWQYRIQTRPIGLAAGIINSLAWFAISIPVLQLAWVLSDGGKRLIGVHFAVGAMALCGCISEAMARLLDIGSQNAAEWLASDFNLDNWLGQNDNDQIGWRTLEVARIVVGGIVLWVDAIEWLALFGILVFIHVSAKSDANKTFSSRWIILGDVIAAFSIVDFVADLLRFDSWRTFSTVSLFFSAVNRLLLLPIWLIVLGLQLPAAKDAFIATRPSVSTPSIRITPTDDETRTTTTEFM